MKTWKVLASGAAVAALLACTSGSTLDTNGDGGSSDGGGSDGGGSTTIDIKDLDKTCTVTTDCVAVFTGDACAICQCANDVIAKKNQTAFDAKVRAAEASCGPRPAIACAADCAQVVFSCSGAGKCVIGISADGG
jgi:hypothetical protein